MQFRLHYFDGDEPCRKRQRVAAAAVGRSSVLSTSTMCLELALTYEELAEATEPMNAPEETPADAHDGDVYNGCGESEDDHVAGDFYRAAHRIIAGDEPQAPLAHRSIAGGEPQAPPFHGGFSVPRAWLRGGMPVALFVDWCMERYALR